MPNSTGKLKLDYTSDFWNNVFNQSIIEVEELAPKGYLSPLLQLGLEYNIAPTYIDVDSNKTPINEGSIKAVLQSFGLNVDTDDDVNREIGRIRDAKVNQLIPPTVVHIEGRPSKVRVRAEGEVKLELEDGSNATLPIKGEQIDLPADLPLGYHTLVIKGFRTTLISAPAEARMPYGLENSRAWGLVSHFYSVRSSESWGIGDFADLADLATLTGESFGADFLLINPTHADTPGFPQTPSPYLPTNRNLLNTIYIRPETTDAYRVASAEARAKVDALALKARELNKIDFIDRDQAWNLKRQALFILFEDSQPEIAYDSSSLSKFARWCADQDGGFAGPDFYYWLQGLAKKQLLDAHRAAITAGAKIGLASDLAVGVHPEGAAVAAHPEDYIRSLSVGAPPDVYNQQGQDWSQPPFDPRAMEKTGYASFRRLIQSMFEASGAIRIDHMLGMFRRWVIPRDGNPDGARRGVYLYYNHDIIVSILCLEAVRNEGIIIGEDMGVIPPFVMKYLAARKILGTSVLWFEHERDNGVWSDRPLKMSDYRRYCFTSVTTHDIPPTAGYLQDEHIKLREQLGLLVEDPSALYKASADERAKLKVILGIKSDDPFEITEALNLAIFDTPSILLGVSLTDLVGETKTQNQPGTDNEYANWRVPLHNRKGELVLLDDLLADQQLIKLTNQIKALKSD